MKKVFYKKWEKKDELGQIKCLTYCDDGRLLSTEYWPGTAIIKLNDADRVAFIRDSELLG